jgi:hypothetical protein
MIIVDSQDEVGFRCGDVAGNVDERVDGFSDAFARGGGPQSDILFRLAGDHWGVHVK